MLHLLHATCVVHAALLRRYEERVRALESASAATSAKNADLQVRSSALPCPALPCRTLRGAAEPIHTPAHAPVVNHMHT